MSITIGTIPVSSLHYSQFFISEKIAYSDNALETGAGLPYSLQ
jgi:hypothetical protein